MAYERQTATREPGSRGWLLIPAGVAVAGAGVVYLVSQIISLNINTSLFGQSAADTFELKAWLASGVPGERKDDTE